MLGRRHKDFAPDERVIVRFRTNPRVLILPIGIVMLFSGVFGVMMANLPSFVEPWGGYALIVIFAVLLVIFAVNPFLRWAATSYTITTHRVTLRAGVIRRVGQDLPINRISNVAYTRGLLDRIGGSGTIRITTSADTSVSISGIPEVQDVYNLLVDLIHASSSSRY
ncbi:PH domain-containing protein [Propionibacterium sp.]|uniref:PH domain-containing protein n=1 Tax=Propionibacterium sp. TaxID=1977903 RepID=UPI0039E88509